MLTALSFFGCGSPDSPTQSEGGPPVADADLSAGDRGSDDGDGDVLVVAPDGPRPDGDVGGLDTSTPDGAVKQLSRGLSWVRHNPMFISAIVVSMGQPPASWVEAYFDDFKANAVHLWADGLQKELSAWQGRRPNARWVSWLNDDGTTAEQGNNKVIGGLAPNTAGRIGYQIGDEPQNMADLLAMEKGVNAVRKADPDALIFVNFNDAVTQQMLAHHETMDCDIVSYDRYTRNPNSYEHRELVRQQGLKLKLPYWRYMRAYYTGGSVETAESDLRWDAFSGIVYGFTGHSWFVYQAAPHHEPKPAFFNDKSFASAKTSLYAIAASINVELRNLGRCITQLTSTDVRYISAIPFLLPPRTKLWTANAGGDPYITNIAPAPGSPMLDISIGFFVDDHDEQYVAVQNACREHGPWPIDHSLPGTIRVSFDFASAPAHVDRAKVLSLSRTTAKVEALSLTSLGGSLAQLDLPLGAGDVVLFKYATGESFSLGP